MTAKPLDINKDGYIDIKRKNMPKTASVDAVCGLIERVAMDDEPISL